MSPASTDEDQARRVKIDKTELDRDAMYVNPVLKPTFTDEY